MEGRRGLMGALLVLCLFVQTISGQDWPNTEEDADPQPDKARPSVTCDSHGSQRVCSNLARVTVHALNQQVRKHLTANYEYMAMYNFFERDDQSYRGFAKLFQSLAGDHKTWAEKLLSYINTRGGNIHLKPIQDPEQEWGGPMEALSSALNTERSFIEHMLDVHWMAQEKNDPHLQNEIEGEYLDPQVVKVKKLADHLTNVQRLNSNHVGLNLYDQWLFEGKR